MATSSFQACVSSYQVCTNFSKMSWNFSYTFKVKLEVNSYDFREFIISTQSSEETYCPTSHVMLDSDKLDEGWPSQMPSGFVAQF